MDPGTLERGLKRFQQEVESIEAANKVNNTNNKTISGDVAFFLYGTLGFPIDLTEVYFLFFFLQAPSWWLRNAATR